jgi:hypothetical protein
MVAYHASLAVLSAFMALCGQESSPQEPVMMKSRVASMSATVEAIDHESRMITLRGPHGNSITFRVDDRVKNLSQVNAGDKVVVGYLQSLAVQVVKPGASEDEQDTVLDSAEPGEKPAGAAARKTTVTATVEMIEPEMPSITLRGPEGNLLTIKDRKPQRLQRIKVGDTLKVTYLQAVAVSLEPASKPAR